MTYAVVKMEPLRTRTRNSAGLIPAKIRTSEAHFCESCREFFPSEVAIKFHNSRVHRPRRMASNMYHEYFLQESPKIKAKSPPTPPKPKPPSRITLYPKSDPRNRGPTALLRCKSCPFSLFTTAAAYRAHRKCYHVGISSKGSNTSQPDVESEDNETSSS